MKSAGGRKQKSQSILIYLDKKNDKATKSLLSSQNVVEGVVELPKSRFGGVPSRFSEDHKGFPYQIFTLHLNMQHDLFVLYHWIKLSISSFNL